MPLSGVQSGKLSQGGDAVKYTDQQLIGRVASTAKGFNGWHDGMYAIGVRSRADVPDAFDDKFYLAEAKGNLVKFHMATSCTTHPGVDVLKNFRTKFNKAGAAVLVADNIVYNSHIYGRHKDYPAYRQNKGFPYTRDQDGDSKAETFGPVLNDIIWSNIHHAKDEGISVRIGNWSAGCTVLNNDDHFERFMSIMSKRPLTYALLKEF
jgi:hypothetical protein